MKKLLLPLLALMIAGCSKDKESADTNPYEDDYRFFVRGNVEGLPVEYNAGEDDYFLETNYSFADSVVEMSGTLAPDGPSMQEAFVIKVRSQNSMASPEQFRIEQNLRTGPMAFRDATEYRSNPETYLISLSCDTLGQYQSHQWVFPDGSVSSAVEVQKTVNIQNFQTYPVTLQTTGSLGCDASVTHHIPLNNSCDATFDITLLAGLQAELELENIIGTVEAVQWYINGESVVLQDSILSFSLASSYEITCVVEFADGCTKTIAKKFGSNLLVDCLDDFYYEKEKERIHDPLQLGTVEIIYYDAAGKQYSSYYQDVMGDFKIVSSSQFERNENGQATTRFFFETDVILKSNDGSSVELTDFFGSFAVAHP